ncbi:MAG: archease [Candidatus Thorarchaeota archaeon]
MLLISNRGFRFHEHTADITIECWAPSLKEAFSEAALAAFEVVLDTSTVEPVSSTDIAVQGLDLKELLVEWIGHLISLIDINYQFYSRFDVIEIDETTDGYTLQAKVWGADIDHEVHDTRTEVKAMTYADMKIQSESDKTTIWFTLDL